jgi:hypothetical protein
MISKFAFLFILSLFLFLIPESNPHAYSWGFFAHQKINRMAVFTLPDGMIGFYKEHLDYIETQVYQ